MRDYMIMRDEENKIVAILQKYDKCIDSVNETEMEISEWNKKTTREIVDDKKTIEILDYLFGKPRDEAIKKRCLKAETALDEIESIIFQYNC